jgi:anti-sigma factor RsiW
MNEHLSIEQLTDFLHHALPPEDDAAVYAHINACIACRTLYEQEAALSEALRAHARASERELPAGVSAAIWDAIAMPAPTFADRLREFGAQFGALLRPVVLVPVAVVAVFAVLLLPQVSRIVLPSATTASVQSIDASYYLQDHAAMNRTVPFADTAAVVSSPLTTSVAFAANAAQ